MDQSLFQEMLNQTNQQRAAASEERYQLKTMHARAFFVSGFVSVENKERCIYLP